MNNLVNTELTTQLHSAVTSSSLDTSLQALVFSNDGRIALVTPQNIAFRQCNIDDNTVGSQTMELYRHLTNRRTEGIICNNGGERTNLNGVAINLPLAGKRYLLCNIGGKGTVTFRIAIVHGSQSLVTGSLRARQCAVSSKLSIDDGILLRLRYLLQVYPCTLVLFLNQP